jgi:hypothetical protein
MNSKKKILYIVASFGLFVATAQAAVTFSWGTTTAPNRLYSDLGKTVLLQPSSSSDWTTSCFIQLIWDVSANGLNQAVNSGNGIAGGSDDQVVATAWVGQGQLTTSGRFSASFTESLAIGSRLYIRAWNAPSSNYSGGATDTAALIPVAGLYGDSSTYYSTTGDPLGAPPPNEITTLANFGGGISTTITPVPEPSTVALLGIGLVAVALRRRLKA